ncbi:MAG: hypothetical protein ABR538_18190 [Candidatus Binatia bacterium]
MKTAPPGLVLALGFGLVCVLAACSAKRIEDPLSQSLPASSAATAGDAEYAVLVERVAITPRQEDLRALREAYVRTSRYTPYDGREEAEADLVFDALDDGDLERCRLEAFRLLDHNYTSLYGHFGAMVCNRKDGRTAEADFHEDVAGGLLDVIRATGDGKSHATAFSAISTAEIRAFLTLQGLEVLDQNLSQNGDRWFDIMSVRDPATGKEFPLYFDITLPWSVYPAEKVN